MMAQMKPQVLQQRPAHAPPPAMAARGATVGVATLPGGAERSGSAATLGDEGLLRCSAAAMASSSSMAVVAAAAASRYPVYASPSPTNPALLNKTRLSYRGSSSSSSALQASSSSISAASDGLSPATAAFFAAHEQSSPPPPAITKSDAEFAAMGVEFVDTREGVRVQELNDLFERVGFPRRDPERLALALEHTAALVWVRATRQSRVAKLGQLLGFARATSDGALAATIWDVAVLPAWQRSGLGRAVVERLTRRLVEDGVSTITLYAEPKVVGMYRKLGFVEADQTEFRGLAFQRRRPAAAAAGGQRGGGARR
jgi:ribosomal protein S18 acetylase RimI-like enzyme